LNGPTILAIKKVKSIQGEVYLKKNPKPPPPTKKGEEKLVLSRTFTFFQRKKRNATRPNGNYDNWDAAKSTIEALLSCPHHSKRFRCFDFIERV